MIDDNQKLRKSRLANDINKYIAEAIDYYKRRRGFRNIDISEQLGVSENFIKKIASGRAHYNVMHIWTLSNFLDVDVNAIYPPKNNFEQYKKIRPHATRDSYQDFIQRILGGIINE